jgi:toxin FitB
MFLIDTNVISELRLGQRINPGVTNFFDNVDPNVVFLSVITMGELRRGAQIIRHRRDIEQADRLERWVSDIAVSYAGKTLPVDDRIADLWGRLRVPHPENEIDKLIAATAMIYGLVVVTRNVADFARTGVAYRNPFT